MRWNFFFLSFLTWGGHTSCLCAYFYSLISTQTFAFRRVPAALVDSCVEVNECPFSGLTSSGSLEEVAGKYKAQSVFKNRTLSHYLETKVECGVVCVCGGGGGGWITARSRVQPLPPQQKTPLQSEALLSSSPLQGNEYS